MKVLLVGSGESGKHFSASMLPHYDRIGIVNGALAGRRIKFDDYFAFDAGCWKYDWFYDTYQRATRMFTSPRIAGDNRLEEGPELHVFVHGGPAHIISDRPGAHIAQALIGKRQKEFPLIALQGTVLHSALHVYAWEDDVESVTLLGFEHDLDREGRYHWYEDPIPYDQQPRLRPKLTRHVPSSARAITEARRRIRVEFHETMGGPLREFLDSVPKL